MHNKRKCRSCVYHMKYTGGGKVDDETDFTSHIMCGYGLMKHTTCMKSMPDGTLLDIRGDDPENCLLYTKGHKRANKVLC